MKIHLAQWRKIRKFTTIQLGQAVGVSCYTISALESGRMLPRLKTALKISAVLKVPVWDIWEMEIYDYFLGGFKDEY